MAVAYWSFERFIKGISGGVYYIVNYKGTLYLIEQLAILNLSTLEFSKRGFEFKNFKKSYINGERISDIWENIEIVEEGNAYTDSFKIQLKAARLYEKRVSNNINNPYINYISKINILEYPRKPGKVMQYMSYDYFIELANSNWYLKKFTIKYNDKIYLLKKGAFKSKFSEISPQNKLINIFYRYEDMLFKSKFEGKSLYEIWEDCEYIINNKISLAIGGRRDIGTYKEQQELKTILLLAQDNMIKQGKTPKIILPK